MHGLGPLGASCRLWRVDHHCLRLSYTTTLRLARSLWLLIRGLVLLRRGLRLLLLLMWRSAPPLVGSITLLTRCSVMRAGSLLLLAGCPLLACSLLLAGRLLLAACLLLAGRLLLAGVLLLAGCLLLVGCLLLLLLVLVLVLLMLLLRLPLPESVRSVVLLSCRLLLLLWHRPPSHTTPSTPLHLESHRMNSIPVLVLKRPPQAAERRITGLWHHIRRQHATTGNPREHHFPNLKNTRKLSFDSPIPSTRKDGSHGPLHLPHGRQPDSSNQH